MTITELHQALNGTGLPVVYHSFKKAPTPPYLIYLFSHSSDLVADNQNYAEINNFQVELYNIKKDPTIEKLVEDKFKELKLPYVKTETFIENEGLFQVLYLIQTIGG